MLYFDSINLTDTKYFNHGPFNYGTNDDSIQPKQYVALTH